MKFHGIYLMIMGLMFMILGIYKLMNKKQQDKLSAIINGEIFPVEYHIKIVPINETKYWQIKFTNNNWITYQKLEKVLYIKERLDWFEPRMTDFFEYNAALEAIENIKTYDDCVQYNENQIQLFKELTNEYKNIPKEPEPKKEEDNRTEIIIK